MIASVLIHFVSCVNQFPVSISRNLIYSVSLGLRKIQLFDLAYRLADRPLRGMQDVDRIESDRTSTLLCLIVGGGGSNKMHQGENYQHFLKRWGCF